ncbi:MAG: L,D-transpeptidase family protein [Deferrisomatales bacterium]|nr:L,D-transpeptidase family protein [Deferrisomatales bacterium]
MPRRPRRRRRPPLSPGPGPACPRGASSSCGPFSGGASDAPSGRVGNRFDELPLYRVFEARSRLRTRHGPAKLRAGPRRGGDSPKTVDPTTVDWAAVSLQREALHFRQLPGPENAMGRVKFRFPNRFHVYFHDTPSRGLFAQARRDFSRGCIRVAEPVRLAEYLLAIDPRWSPQALGEVLAQGRERTVLLPEPVPVHVHVEYFTTWVEKDGAVHFRSDIYGHDDHLATRLRRDAATDGSVMRLAAVAIGE